MAAPHVIPDKEMSSVSLSIIGWMIVLRECVFVYYNCLAIRWVQRLVKMKVFGSVSETKITFQLKSSLFFLVPLGHCLSLLLFRSHNSVFPFLLSSFQAMFSLCMVESGADEVNLRGVTSLGLKQALEFAYTGQVRCQRRYKQLCLLTVLNQWYLSSVDMI